MRTDLEKLPFPQEKIRKTLPSETDTHDHSVNSFIVHLPYHYNLTREVIILLNSFLQYLGDNSRFNRHHLVETGARCNICHIVYTVLLEKDPFTI